jgi:uncharacterized membrane protein required for colicin V production
VCLGILGLALLRGLAIGAIREAFSLASVAAAVVMVRLFTTPIAAWLLEVTELDLGSLGARIAGGGLVAVATMATMAGIGRMLRRGARVMGLGIVDRLAGGALGAAEGVLVSAILLLALSAVLGANHPTLARSRSLAALGALERTALPDDPAEEQVASPPPGL